MSNTITDQLGIVEKSYPRSFLLFARSLKATPFYDQVVFREDGNIRLVSSQGERRLRLRKGDNVLRIYRTPCSYQLVGIIATKENYVCAYEISIEITVNDPIPFASSYFREEDPVEQAINAFEIGFEMLARGKEYDKLLQIKLNLGKWSNEHLKQFGIYIEQKGKTSFREDPFHTQLSLLQQNLKSQEEKLRAEQKIQQLQDEIKKERDQALQEEEHRAQARQRDFERQEKTKDQLHEISANLRQVAAEEISKVLKERIVEGFVRGRNPKEISEEYFSLVGIFEGHKHSDLDKNIITSGLLVDGSVNYSPENDAQISMGPDDSTHEEAAH